MRRFNLILALALSASGAESLPKTVRRVCTKCHQASVFTSRRHTRSEWADIVAEMQNYGAKATRAEFRQITEYLSKGYPAGPARRPPSARPPNTPR